ncbi:MAG TPA: ATP synthase subunit I, partial [Thermoanaerobaculia bacterium]
MTDDTPAEVLRRIRWLSVAAYAVMAVFLVIFRGFRPLAGLTCSAAVVMINFLWLEERVDILIQQTPHLHTRKLTWRALKRFAVLGVALTVTIYVARFNALSVLLGFSIVVVGIMAEAL